MDLLTKCQATFTRLYDMEPSDIPPDNPAVGQTWMDTSTSPPTARQWDGKRWVGLNVDLQIGGRNLAPGTISYREDSPFVTSSARKDNYGFLSQVFDVEPNTTYIIQVKVDGTYSTHQTSGVDPAEKKCALYLYERCINSGKPETDFDYAIHCGSENVVNGATTGLGIWKRTTTANAKTLRVRYNTYSDGNTVITVKFWDLKVEKGNIATDWSPCPEDVEEKIDTQGEALTEEMQRNYTEAVTTSKEIMLQALEEYTKSGDFESYKETVESQLTLLASQMELKFTETTQQIADVNGDLQSKYETITKYFAFDINGLTIGKSDSPYKMVLDNDRLSLTANDIEVLWLDAVTKEVHTPSTTITDRLNLFGYAIEQDEGGNVNCAYTGGGE